MTSERRRSNLPSDSSQGDMGQILKSDTLFATYLDGFSQLCNQRYRNTASLVRRKARGKRKLVLTRFFNSDPESRRRH